MKDERNYSLAAHNTFGIDARCRRYIEFSSVAEAEETARLLRTDGSPYLVIGGGSNLLLTGDFEGTVVRSAISDISESGDNVHCGSGVEWDRLVDWLISRGLYGAENLSLIPGDVGASAVQNIGAYGAEAKDIITQVEAVHIPTGELRLLDSDDCRYAYRYSRFKGDWRGQYLITHVDFRLSREYRPRLDYSNLRSELDRRGIAEPTARQLRDVIISIRRDKLPDPKVLGNGGSFFMNPVVSREQYEQLAAQFPAMPHYHIDEDHEKIPAGWLIEQCGWKGRAMGRAGVYDRQALVLVNLGGATGREIVRLCDAIRADVAQKFGIAILPEVNIV